MRRGGLRGVLRCLSVALLVHTTAAHIATISLLLPYNDASACADGERVS
jgi:hypothetical protein